MFWGDGIELSAVNGFLKMFQIITSLIFLETYRGVRKRSECVSDFLFVQWSHFTPSCNSLKTLHDNYSSVQEYLRCRFWICISFKIEGVLLVLKRQFNPNPIITTSFTPSFLSCWNKRTPGFKLFLTSPEIHKRFRWDLKFETSSQCILSSLWNKTMN